MYICTLRIGTFTCWKIQCILYIRSLPFGVVMAPLTSCIHMYLVRRASHKEVLINCPYGPVCVGVWVWVYTDVWVQEVIGWVCTALHGRHLAGFTVLWIWQEVVSLREEPVWAVVGFSPQPFPCCFCISPLWLQVVGFIYWERDGALTTLLPLKLT